MQIFSLLPPILLYSLIAVTAFILLLAVLLIMAVRTRRKWQREWEKKRTEAQDKPIPEWQKNPPKPIAKEEIRIVGINKPIGFWTKLVMSEKMDFLLERIHLEEGQTQGYWQAYVQAQAAAAGKRTRKGR